jgi:SAM-dependent methyltransferase
MKFIEQIPIEEKNKIIKIFNAINDKSEFEILFKGKINYFDYVNILKYNTFRASEYNMNILKEDSLDINLTIDDIVYRLTIIGVNNINNYITFLSTKNSHVIYKYILSKLNSDKSIKLIKKIKNKIEHNDLIILDFDLKVKLSNELDITKKDMDILSKIDEKTINILFRYKQRVSLFIEGDDKSEHYVKADLTIVKSTDKLKNINNVIKKYELEIEFYNDKNKSNNNKIFDIIINEVDNHLKVIEQNNYIISKTLKNEILKEYQMQMGNEKLDSLNKSVRQPVSLEIQHLTEILPNKYAVTDKADGDRHVLFIYGNKVYLISTNMHIKFTNIILTKDNTKYNNSILDGEYIYIEKENKFLYLIFDCMFCGNENIRNENNFLTRLSKIDEIIKNVFLDNNKTNYIQQIYTNIKNDIALEDISKFYEKELTNYMIDLNKSLENKNEIIFKKKIFIPVLGIYDWEIFKYSTLLWNNFVENDKINCPYILDGLIYHPLDQEYISNPNETKLFEYKWKPSNTNSIDFYILFKKNYTTNKDYIVYDNSNKKHAINKTYKICNLYVNDNKSGYDQPVLFDKIEEVYLYIVNGEVRDINGELINNETIVEFVYKNDPNVEEQFKWIPIRTRYDKTEIMTKFKKNYGNNIVIANKIWRSIINQVSINDFQILSIGNDKKNNSYSYDNKMKELRSNIKHELIVTASKENVYYQIISKLAKPMRQFHNWIKSILIYTFGNPLYKNNQQLSVLDIGCGRGGDIMKFYYIKVLLYVGIDIDKEGILSATDGAISRYEQQRRKKPNFPNMYFLQADAGGILEFESQNRLLGGMNDENKKLLNMFFSKDSKKRTIFDTINCQFAIHYLLNNDICWKNFKNNINMSLKIGGFIIITTFDAMKIIDLLLQNNGKYTEYYVNNSGEKKILFEIIQKYDVISNKQYFGTGYPINVYLSWLSYENVYKTEYLVNYDFLIKEFNDDCNLELVDSDLFENQYNIHKNFITEYSQYEENPLTNKFLKNVKDYYVNNRFNNSCKIFTNLTRYYVFKKKDNMKI